MLLAGSAVTWHSEAPHLGYNARPAWWGSCQTRLTLLQEQLPGALASGWHPSIPKSCREASAISSLDFHCFVGTWSACAAGEGLGCVRQGLKIGIGVCHVVAPISLQVMVPVAASQGAACFCCAAAALEGFRCRIPAEKVRTSAGLLPVLSLVFLSRGRMWAHSPVGGPVLQEVVVSSACSLNPRLMCSVLPLEEATCPFCLSS